MRPVIILHTAEPLRPRIHLRGVLPDGAAVEDLITTPAPWYAGRMVFTAPHAYRCLEHLEVADLPAGVPVEVRTADLTRTDLTLLLPFWAGMLTRRQAEQVVRRLHSPQGYQRLHGLPLVPSRQTHVPAWQAVHMLWNLFVVEALERHGWRREAAELLGRLWRTAAATLAREGVFREAYHALTGEGMGQRNVLLGLPPLSPALRLAGLGRVAPKEVVLQAENAWAFPLEFTWRGVSLRLSPQGGEVRLADGTQADLPAPPARLFLQAGEPE